MRTRGAGKTKEPKEPKEPKETATKKKRTKNKQQEIEDDCVMIVEDEETSKEDIRKFFNQFDEELKKLNEIEFEFDYQEIYNRFEEKLQEFKNENIDESISVKKDSASSPTNNRGKTTEIKNFAKLAQKLKTPMELKIKPIFGSLIKKNNAEKAPLEPLPKFNINESEEDNRPVAKNKSKKRSAEAAEILIDDEKEDQTIQKSKNSKSSSNLKKKSKLDRDSDNANNEPKTPKPSSKKKTKIEHNEQHDNDLNMVTKVDDKKSNEDFDHVNKKTIEKEIATDKKSDTEESNTSEQVKKKKVKKVKKSETNNKKESSESKLEGDVMKSAAKMKHVKSIIDERKSRLSKSRMSEKRKSVLKVKIFLKDVVANNNQIKTELKAAANGENNAISSITSNSKKSDDPDEIKKSIIDKSSKSSSTGKTGSMGPPEDPDQTPTNRKSQQIRISDAIKANVSSSKDEEAILEIKNNTRTPKLMIQKLPTNILASGKTIKLSQVSTTLTTQTTRPLVNVNSTHSQLKSRTLAPQTASMSNINSKLTTPLKSSSIYSSLSNLNNPNNNTRQSFVKFLERNTPSKLTRTEHDERRKQEYLLKEKKEKERLEEIARQKAAEQEKKKKANEEKAKKLLEFKEKQREEQEAKAREAERKRLEMEKKIEEQEQARREAERKKQEEAEEMRKKREEIEARNREAAEKKRQEELEKKKKISVSKLPTIMLSATKKHITTSIITKPGLHSNQSMSSSNSINTNSILSKKFEMYNQKLLQNCENSNGIIPCINVKENDENINPSNNLETTYILNSPKKPPPVKETKYMNQPTTIGSYDVTPLQVPKLKDEDNYDVSQLRSEDETDDEDEPSKPIPAWAKEPYLSQKAQMQSSIMVNFTRLFRASCQHEVVLENIFKHKRKKFTERSSSANWSSPPLWRTNGLTGEESFMQLRKNL